MPDYERTAKVNTEPEDAYRFLAEPRNLPTYVASMSLARPEQGDHLRAAAEIQGRHEEGEAQFTTDPARRRIEWGAEGQSGYQGSIDVSGTDGGWDIREADAPPGSTALMPCSPSHDRP